MKKLLLLLLLAGFVFAGCKNDVGNGENDSVPYDEPEGEVYTKEGPGTDDDLTIMVKIDNQAITTEEWLKEMSEYGIGYWDLGIELNYYNKENYVVRLLGPSSKCEKKRKLTYLYKKIPKVHSISTAIGSSPVFSFGPHMGIDSELSELIKDINEKKYDKNVFTISFHNIQNETLNGIEYTLKFNDTQIEKKTYYDPQL